MRHYLVILTTAKRKNLERIELFIDEIENHYYIFFYIYCKKIMQKNNNKSLKIIQLLNRLTQKLAAEFVFVI